MYRWTPAEIDEQDLGILLDYIVVSHKTADEGDKVRYIDEVM